MPPATNSIRANWGVPLDARVCIRLGGESTFDIPWVHQTIIRVLEENKDFYFIGYNTHKFTHHPRARFLSSINNKAEKSNALKSADVFLHARRQGESFGMAILEAMQLSVPVLAWKGGWDRNHTKLLDKESLYKNQNELYFKLIKGLSDNSVNKSFQNSKLYSITNVMKIFKEEFEINKLK
jgi:glycosyltransferase involved in cell wall biosynthesis